MLLSTEAYSAPVPTPVMRSVLVDEFHTLVRPLDTDASRRSLSPATLTIAVAAVSGEAPDLSTENIGAIVWVGLAEMAISFVFWLSALQRARSAAAISSLIFVSPFLSLVLLSTIAGEAIRPSTPIGLAFIVAGMLAQQRLRARSGV